MRSRALPAIVVLAGAVAGSLLMLSAPDVFSAGSTTAPAGAPLTTAPPAGIPTTVASPTTTTAISDQVLLVWTPGGLPDGLADRVAALPGVNAVTVVRSDLVHLSATYRASGDLVDRPGEGYVIPIEVMAFDSATYPAFLPKGEGDTLAGLGEEQVALGATSAELRRLGPGAVLELEDGSQLSVAAVVDDVLIGAAEAAVAVAGSGPERVTAERYLLVRFSGARTELEASVAALLPPGMAARIRGPGETPVLRHGDAVLPQVQVKEVFGEFAYRPGQGRSFDIDPDWVEANVTTTRVPILGTVTCNRNLIPALAAAMTELAERNLAFLVDPDQYRGCFNPRYIAPGRGISRHAWGAAVDLNMGANPEGVESAQDPRLIEVMERWGFTSGNEWLIPDPGHFEYVGPGG